MQNVFLRTMLITWNNSRLCWF